MSFISKSSRIILIISVVVSLSSCNTISGIGKDIGAAGKTLSDAARNHKNY